MEQKFKKKSLEELQKQREKEIAEILMKADENKEEAIIFSDEGRLEIKNETEALLDQSIDDPEAKYELYYKTINRLLQQHLKSGDSAKIARNLIYEEKNTFLTRGHRLDKNGLRHADSRMAYQPDMKELVDIILKWIGEHGTMYDLWIRIRDLNISKGYGAPKE